MKHDKIKLFVEYPFSIDMRPYVLSIKDNKDPVMYDLYAVSNHVGIWKGLLGDSVEKGHYQAYCKYALTGEWYFYDDGDKPKHIPNEKIKDAIITLKSYMLFYQRRN